MKRILGGLMVLTLTMAFLGTCPGAGSALSQTGPLDFTLLHTNDEHSALLPSPLTDYNPSGGDPTIGGFARLAQAVKQIRTEKAQAGEPMVLVSAGDFLGGSPFAWLALEGYAVELELMQAIGYDIIALGNHEYDFGPELLASYLEAAGYPEATNKTVLLASNTRPPAGHELGGMGIRGKHLMVLENGLTLGFFSIIGVDAIDVAPLAAPVEFAEQVAVATAAVSELRSAGADVVIAVNHAGLDEDEGLARQVSGIDIIVSGHCHTALAQPRMVNGTIIAQTGSSLSNLGILELSYDPAGQVVSLRNGGTGSSVLMPLDDTLNEDVGVSGMIGGSVDKLNAMIAELTDGRFTDIKDIVVTSEFIVSNKPNYSETPFGNFVADAMKAVGEEATGVKVDFAIQADGVIRGSLLPGTTAAAKGDVALLDLLDLVSLGAGPDQRPGYPLVAFYFTGEEVRRVLEISLLLSELLGDSYFLQVSGLRMSYDPALAVLARLPGKGTPVPSTRAVISAERFTGVGLQQGDQFVPLKRGDNTLYHVVSDYYLAAFLPMVGDLLPSLGLVMKDASGNPISPEEAIVYRDEHELKVWQTVAEYAAMQPVGSKGVAAMPVYYESTSGRQTARTVWPYVLAAGGLLLLIPIILTVGLIRRKRRRSRRYPSYSYRR
ncbi:MAG TPA: bifunctional UDP-sugar hydrolase/5'-nucleotidase [Bacillota bacterium]|nr:bifunctional UDP-sugar hydrolase/5'-nucleotidase [Bacillota bacterium]